MLSKRCGPPTQGLFASNLHLANSEGGNRQDPVQVQVIGNHIYAVQDRSPKDGIGAATAQDALREDATGQEEITAQQPTLTKVTYYHRRAV